MIVKRLEDIIGTDQEVSTDNWISRRLLLKKDGMGFSLHDTVIKKGTETFIWYKNHLEAVYCIEGEGEVEVLDDNGEKTGEIYPLKPGTVYALNGHEKHLLRATADMRMVCVFNPPVTGQEVHDENGVYPLTEED
ncbi:L-ectoine synthase [Caldalkalibacillus thermarum TA2.A1]|uniref:L-ectoine synthase n=1 Tax=Caldalkalibacillus thermarum (strain TA2.A1) TaxID=986075 RepID=F5L4B7_CALTT|nr:ectoine synthase [Caldalkalibacillus thermarum]EGL83813.1 L-ectoine synthase [Caldalkalibacillus thermarum TA2.A1]QZT35405.1 ectoine synthase [Caldalkalibacillus thermarum TA2.A1]